MRRQYRQPEAEIIIRNGGYATRPYPFSGWQAEIGAAARGNARIRIPIVSKIIYAGETVKVTSGDIPAGAEYAPQFVRRGFILMEAG